MAKFFLRTSKKRGTATLYMSVNRPSQGMVNWYINTSVTVDIEAWNKAQKSAKSMMAFFATENGKRAQDMMSKVEGVVRELLDNGAISGNGDKANIEREIMGIVDGDAIKAMEEVEKRKREEEDKRLCIIANYYDYFFDGISNGTMLKGNRRVYEENSVTGWRTFGKHLKGYLKKRKCEGMTFEDINRSFADGFTLYLEKEGMMAGTINQQIICFRRLCNAAAVDEKNRNLISVKVWHECEVDESEKRAKIVLSDEEVNALYDMQLTGLKEKVRDVWVLGYLSAQRVSDYSAFTKDNFKTTANGYGVIALRQKKTKRGVIVPITDERVMELCNKYNYDFPRLPRDTINKYIKMVAKELSVTMPSLCEWETTAISVRERQKEEVFIEMRKRVEAGEKLHGEEAKRYRRMNAYAQEHESGDKLWKRDYAGNVIKQRWELVCCHTSRRSAVTSMYDAGLYDIKDMMSVSGHKTLTNFEKYINRGAIEQAERIAEKAAKAMEIAMRKVE